MNIYTATVKTIAVLGAFMSLIVQAEPYRQLFFDDMRLYVRENFVRVYGEPKLQEVYQDKTLAVEYGWVWALDAPDGRVHMIYLGEHKESRQLICAAAISNDGVHFMPRNTAKEAKLEKPCLPYQLLNNPPKGEIGTVLMDPIAPPEARYKLLFCDYADLDRNRVINYTMSSPDLINWTTMENSCWNPVGTEPMLGAFYNPVYKNITILPRPDWAQRRVARTETTDWHTFTPLAHCLQADSLDPALAEIYGMPAFHYHGWFIGFPHIYYDVPQVRNLKFSGGKMRCELTYSLNGLNWLRSLRVPFLDGDNQQLHHALGGKANMIFINSMREDKDGSILLYGGATVNEHGDPNAGSDPLRSKILIFRLRRDGFIGLKTADAFVTGTVASRAIACTGENLSINLQAKHATCAVYSWKWNAAPDPIPGYGHNDCIAFTGDAPEWHPVWKDHKNLKDLKGQLIVVEIKLQNGTIYSYTIDGVPQMEIECNRYHDSGIPTVRPGF